MPEGECGNSRVGERDGVEAPETTARIRNPRLRRHTGGHDHRRRTVRERGPGGMSREVWTVLVTAEKDAALCIDQGDTVRVLDQHR